MDASWFFETEAEECTTTDTMDHEEEREEGEEEEEDEEGIGRTTSTETLDDQGVEHLPQGYVLKIGKFFCAERDLT